ncbi:hypothetical protein NU195Hw_Modified_28t1 [Hortaea werneckii]
MCKRSLIHYTGCGHHQQNGRIAFCAAAAASSSSSSSTTTKPQPSPPLSSTFSAASHATRNRHPTSYASTSPPSPCPAVQDDVEVREERGQSICRRCLVDLRDRARSLEFLVRNRGLG